MTLALVKVVPHRKYTRRTGTGPPPANSGVHWLRWAGVRSSVFHYMQQDINSLTLTFAVCARMRKQKFRSHSSVGSAF